MAPAALVALVFVFLPSGSRRPRRWPLVLAAPRWGLARIVAARRRRAVRDLVVLVVIAAIAVITLAVTLLGWGIAGPGFGFFGLLTCLVCTVAGLRLGLLVAGLGAFVVLARVPPAPWRQWLPAADPGVRRQPGARADPPDRHRCRRGGRPAGLGVMSRYVRAAEGARAALPQPADRGGRCLLGDHDGAVPLVAFNLQGGTA